MGVQLRLMALLAGLICLSGTGTARAGDAWHLTEVLRIGEVIEVLRDEGLAFGEDLDRDMLDGQGGTFWATQVDRIYDHGRMLDTVRVALGLGMTNDEIDRTLAFFDTDLGQRVISLETSARRAMADPEIEAIARDTYLFLKGSDDTRLAAIARLIRVNDLVERNVTGALNASYYFMRGLTEGGASEMSDAQITADVWLQEEEIRLDTEDWLYGFMLLAYRPLSDAELESYIEFSDTAAGQALNGALFDGFDDMYLAISHALGVQVAKAGTYSDL